MNTIDTLKLLDALKVKYSDVIYATSPSLAAQFENGIAGIEQALNTATPLAAQISPKQLLALAQTASLELDKVIEVFRMAAQPAPVQVPSQREFENWLRSKWTAGYACPKLDGRYTDAAAQSFWECWQAAHGITKGQP